MWCSLFCACIALAALPVYADTIADQQAALQAQLDAINKEIEQNKVQLSEAQKQRTSLERDVAILDYQIQEAQLEIRQRNLAIRQLRNSIAQKQSGIESLDEQVSAGQSSLAQILRKTNEIDNTSMVELILGGGTLTDVFKSIGDFQSVQRALGESFTVMAVQRSDLSARKKALETQQQEEQDLLQLQVLQQDSLKDKERQKQELVDAAKGQEAAYEKVISSKQQTAAQIKAALFSLNGSNRTTSFGDIYQYAKEASEITGVRPALILAILRQETNLGQNIGQCLLTNTPKKGDGKGVNTGRVFSAVMKPTRDVDPFMDITRELGIDPASQVVSCPQAGGYGGAMGPAQFIPSTWILYKDRIAKATGQTPPNPWDPRTATFATAILMEDNGADRGTRASEKLAALRYFAGWANASKPSWSFYGDSVMEFADSYQADIDVLENSLAQR
ncbi:MAG: lytic murein transglycosylase [Patescibacteria group bacterium]|nr:lytic murein transglycosylase [Patescibacteria group bacterium]